MIEPVARALEAVAGPLMAEGLALGMAERIAKIRAFESGEYSGEPCDRCSELFPILYPWGPTSHHPGALRWNLCGNCNGKEAVYRQKIELAQRGT